MTSGANGDQLFRHGDRAPTTSFPNDPYFDESYWPMGHGELTNVGKTRSYELGKWFRKRYGSFLQDRFSSNDIFIRSTHPDRCLMSASTVLAGFFPPKGSQLWNKDLPWQPIPVHTTPVEKDDVLSMTKRCPRYITLLNETLRSEFIKGITFVYSDFFKYVSKHSGWNQTNIRDAATLQINLEIYNSFNSSFIPIWAKSLNKEILLYISAVDQLRYTLTHTMRRLLTGPFWANFFAYFENVINQVSDTPKFLMLSAHDRTITSLLNCMGVYDFLPPPFSAALIWELRKSGDGVYYINLIYKKSATKINKIHFKECGVDCDYKAFKEMLASVNVHGKDWERECVDETQKDKGSPPKPFYL